MKMDGIHEYKGFWGSILSARNIMNEVWFVSEPQSPAVGTLSRQLLRYKQIQKAIALQSYKERDHADRQSIATTNWASVILSSTSHVGSPYAPTPLPFLFPVGAVRNTMAHGFSFWDKKATVPRSTVRCPCFIH